MSLAQSVLVGAQRKERARERKSDRVAVHMDSEWHYLNLAFVQGRVNSTERTITARWGDIARMRPGCLRCTLRRMRSRRTDATNESRMIVQHEEQCELFRQVYFACLASTQFDDLWYSQCNLDSHEWNLPSACTYQRARPSVSVVC